MGFFSLGLMLGSDDFNSWFSSWFLILLTGLIPCWAMCPSMTRSAHEKYKKNVGVFCTLWISTADLVDDKLHVCEQTVFWITQLFRYVLSLRFLVIVSRDKSWFSVLSKKKNHFDAYWEWWIATLTHNSDTCWSCSTLAYIQCASSVLCLVDDKYPTQ